jgi:hypothetical protein
MIRCATRRVFAVFMSSGLLWSLALAQTNRGALDPVAGFAERYPGESSVRSASSGGSTSFWSSYQGVSTPTPGYSENPAMIGGIISTSSGRHCAGAFRMTRC